MILAYVGSIERMLVLVLNVLLVPIDMAWFVLVNHVGTRSPSDSISSLLLAVALLLLPLFMHSLSPSPCLKYTIRLVNENDE
jgi:hypothetical protein